MSQSLTDMAVDVLTTADGRQKAAKTHAYQAAWDASRAAGAPLQIGRTAPPDLPARPEHPALLAPRDVPRRKTGSPEGRAALMHAIAHIELNAVDLHWDIIARFADTPMPVSYFDDWVKAASEEAKHFGLLCDWLEANDSFYGAMPAHAGMWRAAQDTAGDILGRLAVVPMVLEARGLDVTPGMIKIFQQARDEQAVAALNTIYAEEVGHVAYCSKWFHFLCGRHELDPIEQFHGLVRRYFPSPLKPPFNQEKRADAGLHPDFYWPLTENVAP